MLKKNACLVHTCSRNYLVPLRCNIDGLEHNIVFWWHNIIQNSYFMEIKIYYSLIILLCETNVRVMCPKESVARSSESYLAV